MERNTIILVGLMGAGKTTVGKSLAKRLGWHFLDTDHEIEVRTGVSIATIFEIEGEAGFRDRESKVVSEIVHRDNTVIATGGGVVMREDNRRRLRCGGLVVYLCVSPENVIQRLRYDKSRPLLQVPDPLAKLRELYAKRDPYYREVANLVIDADSLSTSGVMKQIQAELAKQCAN